MRTERIQGSDAVRPGSSYSTTADIALQRTGEYFGRAPRPTGTIPEGDVRFGPAYVTREHAARNLRVAPAHLDTTHPGIRWTTIPGVAEPVTEVSALARLTGSADVPSSRLGFLSLEDAFKATEVIDPHWPNRVHLAGARNVPTEWGHFPFVVNQATGTAEKVVPLDALGRFHAIQDLATIRAGQRASGVGFAVASGLTVAGLAAMLISKLGDGSDHAKPSESDKPKASKASKADTAKRKQGDR